MGKFNLNKAIEIYDILKNYNGVNPYIKSLQKGVYSLKNTNLNDFQMEYILSNHDKEPKLINKIVKVASWWGEKKKEEWEIDFTPQKVKIGWFLGETEQFYHLYIQYRQSQTSMMPLFIPKTAILTDFLSEDWTLKNIDFSPYNEKSGLTLKPHQERAIKFLTTRKKAILSLQMGLGKTICGIVAALEAKFNKILVICPASIKTTWEKELKMFVDEDDIVIVNGSNWKESKFTILNYDILKRFYTVPKETKQVKQKELSENGKIEWKTVEKIVKTNKKDIVDECLNNSQLFQSHFDLIIIDESQRLSNKTSGIYEIVEDLIKRSKPEGIYELTGTMITNSPINLYNLLKLIGADITKDWVQYVKTYCDGKQIFANRKMRDYYSNIFIKNKGKNSWYDLTYDEKQELDLYLSKNVKKIWLTNGASNLEELGERIKHLYYRESTSESLKNIKKEVKILDYDFTNEEKIEYDTAWNDYINSQDEKNIDKILSNHKLIEGSIFRQVASRLMIPRTIKLAEERIKLGEKVIIFCAFDKEIYELQEYFKERCVVYNGKMTIKKKDEAKQKFIEDDNCMVFLGNLQSASVGLTLIAANNVIFNSVDFLPAVNEQASFRILRLGQTKDCHIFYQKFNDSYLDRVFEILQIKNEIIENVILDEDEK